MALASLLLAAAAAGQPVPAAVPVYVLVRDVAAGQPLSREDFRTSDDPRVGAYRGALQPSEAEGQEAARRLVAGVVVRRTDLRAPQQVKRGDAVTVLFVSGALQIASQGRALTGGGTGETVRVVSGATHHTFEAVIDGPRRVRILND